MRHDYDNLKRGAVIPATGKTRVTMFLDDDVIEFFRKRATKNGRGYQTEINAQLREAMRPGVAVTSTQRARESVEVVRVSGEELILRQLTDEVKSLRGSMDILKKSLATGTYVKAKPGKVVREYHAGRSVPAKKRPA